MQIVVFGASGKVGRIVVAELLKDGHKVIAFVHSTNPFNSDDNLRIFKGDIHSDNDVEEATKGVNIVICTLGSWGTKKKDVVSSGMKNIITSMKANNISRVVSITGADALAPDDKKTILSKMTHLLISLSPAKTILKDGEKHIELLTESKLNWSILRSPAMNNRGNSKYYRITDKRPKPWQTINRKSVALAIVALIIDQNSYQKSPFIARK